MTPLLLITFAAASNALALTLLKITGDQLQTSGGIVAVLLKMWLFILCAAILYGVSFLLAIKIFSTSSFSKVVPMFVGINVLSSLVIALLYFEETPSISIFLGSMLIISGIWLIQTNTL